jgi:hypothetical protein
MWMLQHPSWNFTRPCTQDICRIGFYVIVLDFLDSPSNYILLITTYLRVLYSAILNNGNQKLSSEWPWSASTTSVFGGYLGIRDDNVICLWDLRSSAVVIKNSVFWVITSCSSLEVNRLFGRTCRFHPQGRWISQGNPALFATCFHVSFMFGLLFDPEDSGDMFHRNVN